MDGLHSTVAAPRASADLFLVTDGLQPEDVWLRVDAEHQAGRAVWVTGALVEPLARQYGVARDGHFWLELAAPNTQSEWIYRARDIFISAAALLLLSPLFAVIAVLVKWQSPGPVFYQTTGVGQGQTHFILRKFRSMYVLDAELDRTARLEEFRKFADNKHTGKVIDATRVTRLGAFLRKHSLDELPQLWNVLRGEMVLIGPRPCLPYEIVFFPTWALRRFKVRPGLSGVSQVTGRGLVTLEQGLMMDVYYVYARTFTFDLRLVMETLRVILLGEGDK